MTIICYPIILECRDTIKLCKRNQGKGRSGNQDDSCLVWKENGNEGINICFGADICQGVLYKLRNNHGLELD
jgi:hypothetical protein